MADRVLTWHDEGIVDGKTRIGPAYYLDASYDYSAVRIHAETAPSLSDAKFDIRLDGASIFDNQTPAVVHYAGRASAVTATRSVELPQGETDEEMAEDFKPSLVFEQGGWVTCVPLQSGGGRNFTIALELNRLSEADEEE